MDDETLTQLLELENAYGYHIEEIPRLPVETLVHDPAPATVYPCLEPLGAYTGCKGAACPLLTCWTGMPTISYVLAMRTRHQTTDNDYARGALCTRCRHVQQVLVPVVHQQKEIVQLPLVQCARHRWAHPVTAAALARRRIPAREDVDLAACTQFAPAEQPLAAVEAHRLQVNLQTRRRRQATQLPTSEKDPACGRG
jgi:hypothetical protein